MAEMETYLLTNAGQITVPAKLAAKINAVPSRRDGWWDQRYSDGKRAADWFAVIDFMAYEAFARGEKLKELPDFA